MFNKLAFGGLIFCRIGIKEINLNTISVKQQHDKCFTEGTLHDKIILQKKEGRLWHRR